MSVAPALSVAFNPVVPSGEAASNAPADDAFAGLVADATAKDAAHDAPSKAPADAPAPARVASDKPSPPLHAASVLAAQVGSKTTSEGAEPVLTPPLEAANDAEAATTEVTPPPLSLVVSKPDEASVSQADAAPILPLAMAVVVPVVPTAPAQPLAAAIVPETPTATRPVPALAPPAPTAPLAAPEPPAVDVAAQAAPQTQPTAAAVTAAVATTPEPVLASAQTAAVEAALIAPAPLAGAAPIRNAAAAKDGKNGPVTAASEPAAAAPAQDPAAAAQTVASSAPAAPAPVAASATQTASAAVQPDPAAAPIAEAVVAASTQEASDPAAAATLGAPPAPTPSASATSAAFMTGSLSHLSQASLETTVQIAAQISSKLAGRSTRFEMGLTPEGLGRVDVSLDIDADGRLQARLAFDNPLAATELRGRADELRRQLENSGFTIAQDGFEFTDRQPSSAGQGFDRRQDRAFASASRLNADADLSQPAPAAWVSLSLTPRGVDMKV